MNYELFGATSELLLVEYRGQRMRLPLHTRRSQARQWGRPNSRTLPRFLPAPRQRAQGAKRDLSGIRAHQQEINLRIDPADLLHTKTLASGTASASIGSQ